MYSRSNNQKVDFQTKLGSFLVDVSSRLPSKTKKARAEHFRAESDASDRNNEVMFQLDSTWVVPGYDATITARTQDIADRVFGSREQLKKVIDILKNATRKPKNWRTAVVGCDEKELVELCTREDVANAVLVLQAMKVAAIEAYENPKDLTWAGICNAMVQSSLNDLLGSGRKLRDIFVEFRANGWKLSHPSRLVDKDAIKHDAKAACILDGFNDLKLAFLAHARANLWRVSVDFMHRYTERTLIPRLRLEIQKQIKKQQKAEAEAEAEAALDGAGEEDNDGYFVIK